MMDRDLSLEQRPELWSKRDLRNHMLAEAGDITHEKSLQCGLDVFWESESQSLVVVSEAKFATLEDTPTTPPAASQPPSIQHKIKSLLLDIFIDVGRSILVQFWAPITTASGQRMLTASHQPFGIGDGLFEGLCRFRKYCAEHQYGASVEDTTPLGPPGRVFTLGGSPGLCPDIRYCPREEFPLKEALDCGIGSYGVLPLFERDGQCCVGVLEVSSLDECFPIHLGELPLEEYDLHCQGHMCNWDKTPPSFTPETRQTTQSLAQFVQQKHGLKLVQVWVPCLCHIAPDATSSGQYDANNSCSSSNPASPSRITRFFRVYFTPLSPLLSHTTDDVPRLEPGSVTNERSLVGRAYSQKKPCFVRDFSQCNIFDYPIFRHIHSFDVEACFAIPLQLIDPQLDPFVLEIFLPRGKNWRDRKIEGILKSLLFTLKEKVQVEKFSVKLSHWDSDYIAYLDVYQNGSSDATAQRLNDHPNTTGETAMASCSRGVEVSPNAAEPEITFEGGAEASQESEIEPSCPNNNQTERDAAASDTILKSAKGNNTAAQDEMNLDHSYAMIVKATYKDDTVKFPLGSNSGIEELRRELCKRFEFKAERFKIKYEEEGDWILVSCDEDLRFRMDDLKSSRQTTMHVSIFPATL